MKARLAGDLAQHSVPPNRLYPPGCQLRILLLQLHPNEEAPQLLGRHRRSPRPTERIEDQIPLSRRGHKGAAHQTQRFLSGMISVTFLVLGDGGDAPDGGDLSGGIEAIYEGVVEGVVCPFSLARPDQCLVSVGASQLEQFSKWLTFRKPPISASCSGSGRSPEVVPPPAAGIIHFEKRFRTTPGLSFRATLPRNAPSTKLDVTLSSRRGG
jgi:hypothetical protein